MENDTINNEKSLIMECLGYLGGKVPFLITAGIVTFIFLVSGLYTSLVARPRAKALAEKRAAESIAQASIAAEESIEALVSASETAAESSEETEITEVTMNSLQGVYVGETGSVIVLYANGTADYYHELVGVNSLNVWTLTDGRISLTIGILGFCEVNADFNNASEPYAFTSNSEFWDDENFIKISAEAASYTADEMAEFVSEYGSSFS